MNTVLRVTGLSFVAAPRKSFQFLVGASRQRAAPRSQSFGAARLRCATSSVNAGRSEFAPQQRASPAKCSGGSHKCSPQLVATQLQSARRVRPNWSLNRTLCGSPSFGSKSLAQTRPTAKCRLAQTLGRTRRPRAIFTRFLSKPVARL